MTLFLYISRNFNKRTIQRQDIAALPLLSLVESLLAHSRLARAQNAIGREVLDASRRLIEFFSLSHTKDALLRTTSIDCYRRADMCIRAQWLSAVSAVHPRSLEYAITHIMSVPSFFHLSSGSAALPSLNANSFSPATSSLSYVRKFPMEETNYE